MGDKKISDEQLVEIIEAAIFVAGKPLSRIVLKETVLEEFNVSLIRIKQCLETLEAHYSTRGIQLVKVGSGFRFQASKNLSPWLSKLFQGKTPKYSRALLETLSLIAYRQPITRGEIEQVRGVAVSSHIIKTLLERGWVKGVGHKEVPGRPALYATTAAFLDYFSLASLENLPLLPEQQENKINQMLS
ncbi:SMC-Scp complex subunit ScpB [Pseudoalteromonas sp. NBT06-2]|uniref:SMC-Scp complex subunit ScpB n=1 Tax=Pseudoalteromonas sp. NBT06-2 TaxID=2025950 RepID=UPI000BA5A7F1|nr:SMC-Scp complex subunit ScpB [Pseudoalteromonas sp. NBT06-2]PAJ73935.1 SMC-Scp complex subunit ScpB [Pseudoalteromonas sp. NBT06-2]